MPIETMPSGSQMFTGKAINWFALVHLKHAILLWQKGIKSFRGCTMGLLTMNATGFTGKDYPGGKKGLALALADVEALLATRQPDEIERKGGVE